MDDQTISRAEHEEFCKRMEEEHARVNKRLISLEENNKQITEIAISVKELAINMNQISCELKKQGTKLESFEARDGEKWRKAVSYILTTIAGIILGFIFKYVGMS